MKFGVVGLITLTLFSLFGIVASKNGETSSLKHNEKQGNQSIQDLASKMLAPSDLIGDFFSLFNESFETRLVETAKDYAVQKNDLQTMS